MSVSVSVSVSLSLSPSLSFSLSLSLSVCLSLSSLFPALSVGVKSRHRNEGGVRAASVRREVLQVRENTFELRPVVPVATFLAFLAA